MPTTELKKTKMVLTWGMGVESTAVLVRWLTDPSSRDFDLGDLIVLVSMVGNEYASTIRDGETHVLPLLRKHGVRLVQVARAGRLQRDGIVVLDDSRRPTKLHAEGAYTLGAENLEVGTVPTWRPTNRKCSQKFKGFVLDAWLGREFGVAPFRQAVGFNADETDRVERDRSYSAENRQVEYPLVEWGWTRTDALSFLFDQFEVLWEKSACVFCPFSNGKPEALERYRREPEAAVAALVTEFTAMALNPRMALFPSGSLREKLIVAGLEHLVDECDRRISGVEWGLYRVRRIALSKNSVHRKVECLSRGSRRECGDRLRGAAAEAGIPITHEGGIPRCVLKRPTHVGGLVLEETLTAAPGFVRDKCRSGFEGRWIKALSQLRLFDFDGATLPAAA